MTNSYKGVSYLGALLHQKRRTTLKTLNTLPGTNIREAAQNIIDACTDDEMASTTFNGVELTADKSSTVDSIVNYYDEQSRLAAEKYERSPEGIAAAERSEQERVKLQAQYDACMASLPNLDFADHASLLDWFAKLQPATDRIGVVRQPNDGDLILETFVANGYHPNVNLGEESNPENADNNARYIIGQCLDTIDGSIHQVAQHFIEKWKEKFQPKAA